MKYSPTGVLGIIKDVYLLDTDEVLAVAPGAPKFVDEVLGIICPMPPIFLVKLNLLRAHG